jgi:hypothetical protein
LGRITNELCRRGFDSFTPALSPTWAARACRSRPRAAPFCELRKQSELIQTPYSSTAFMASIGASRSNQVENESAP